MKKIQALIYSFILLLFLIMPLNVFGQSEQTGQVDEASEVALNKDEPAIESTEITISFFFSQTCSHCATAKPILEQFANENKNITLKEYEVTRLNASYLLENVRRITGSNTNFVPMIFVADRMVAGWSEDGETLTAITQLINKIENENTPQLIPELILVGGNKQILSDSQISDFQTKFLEKVKENKEVQKEYLESQISQENKEVQDTVKEDSEQTDYFVVPILGKINATGISLPVFTIVLGLIDGFNPCAMWTLLFLISLLITMKDRKRMWILGTTFILVSGLVYFLFMSAWLNFFMIVGIIPIIRILVGVFAILAGVYNIQKSLRKKDAGCDTEHSEKKRKVFQKLKDITQRKELWIALVGISLLALAVNMVEMICSAGLPAIYTQVLAINELPAIQYYAYIALYILFFMIDDIIVFVIAMTTLQAVGIETKYGKATRITGGIIMLIVGILLLLNPELLMF